MRSKLCVSGPPGVSFGVVDEEETDVEEAGNEETDEGCGMPTGMDLDPTVPYDMDTDVEGDSETVEESKGAGLGNAETMEDKDNTELAEEEEKGVGSDSAETVEGEKGVEPGLDDTEIMVEEEEDNASTDTLPVEGAGRDDNEEEKQDRTDTLLIEEAGLDDTEIVEKEAGHDSTDTVPVEGAGLDDTEIVDDTQLDSVEEGKKGSSELAGLDQVALKTSALETPVTESKLPDVASLATAALDSDVPDLDKGQWPLML